MPEVAPFSRIFVTSPVTKNWSGQVSRVRRPARSERRCHLWFR